jgi:hypothetical protein
MPDDQKIEEMIRQKEMAPVALESERTARVVIDVQRFLTRPIRNMLRCSKSSRGP